VLVFTARRYAERSMCNGDVVCLFVSLSLSVALVCCFRPADHIIVMLFSENDTYDLESVLKITQGQEIAYARCTGAYACSTLLTDFETDIYECVHCEYSETRDFSATVGLLVTEPVTVCVRVVRVQICCINELMSCGTFCPCHRQQQQPVFGPRTTGVAFVDIYLFM